MPHERNRVAFRSPILAPPAAILLRLDQRHRRLGGHDRHAAGRTHGLGLVTEPLLADLQVDRVTFAHINLVASLIGAAFCLPVGWMIDRWGVRTALVAVTAALGLAVLGMGEATGAFSLLSTLILVRGFGQSACRSSAWP